MNKEKSIVIALLVMLFISACSSTKNNKTEPPEKYKPDDQELYNTIVHMDSVYFNAYNTCDMATQASIYSDSIEFYHDKGGLTTSKQDILDQIKKNICGKVTRELVPGSIEVYPINGFGAIEMGLHKFHNHMEKEVSPSKASKFIVIWQKSNDGWKMKRIVSLH
jgi:ketosteroid isomerase-like protein